MQVNFGVGSDPSIDLLMDHNTAAGGAQSSGGAICVDSSVLQLGDPSFVNLRAIIQNNQADHLGGAIAAGRFSGALSDQDSFVQINGDVQFLGNKAVNGWHGGALALLEASAYVHKATFSGNQAGLGKVFCMCSLCIIMMA